MADTPRKRVLLTGASGYIGGRLLRRMLDEGYEVRCLTRRPDELRQRVDQSTEVVGETCWIEVH